VDTGPQLAHLGRLEYHSVSAQYLRENKKIVPWMAKYWPDSFQLSATAEKPGCRFFHHNVIAGA
jgi:hypothetical protein